MNKLIFSERMELSDIFDKYARLHEIAENSFSVITFLTKEKLLDIKKTKEYLAKIKEEKENA